MGAIKLDILDKEFTCESAKPSVSLRAIKGGVDCSTFGMQQPNSNALSGNYRFGFAGQENEDDLWGKGNAQFFKFRINDARIGRFFAIDPLARDYPFMTPYQYASNQVIHGPELEGLENAFHIWSTPTAENAQAGVDRASSITPEVRSEKAELLHDIFANMVTLGGYTFSQPDGARMIDAYENGGSHEVFLVGTDIMHSEEAGGTYNGTSNLYKNSAPKNNIKAKVSSSNIKANVSSSPEIQYTAGVEKIRGSAPKNSKLANSSMTTRSGDVVNYDNNGMPEFGPYAERTVKVEGMVGDHNNDFKMFNEQAGFGYSKNAHIKAGFGDYTWHHHQDLETGQLVHKNIHNSTQGGAAHNGAVSIIKHNNENPGPWSTGYNKQLNYKPATTKAGPGY